jgi:flagellar hook assembly protein FlgD
VPNPFNPETRIDFGLPAVEAVTLKVYDASGRLTRTLLANERLDAGFHSVSWNGRDDRSHSVSSGVYFYVIETPGANLSRKMTMLK